MLYGFSFDLILYFSEKILSAQNNPRRSSFSISNKNRFSFHKKMCLKIEMFHGV